MYNVYRSIINDIKELRGKEVRIFGQPTTLSDSVDDYTIDILDVLDSLGEYVINLSDYMTYNYNEETDDDDEVCIFDDVEENDVDTIFEKLEEYGYIKDVCDYKGDNSYNWTSPVSNDFDIKVYKDFLTGEGEFIEFKVHRYGDVRCNYTDSIILHFDNEYEFYEVLSENDIFDTITIDDVDYNIDIRIFSDSYEVFTDDGSYLCTAYGDKDDVIQCIKEAID